MGADAIALRYGSMPLTISVVSQTAGVGKSALALALAMGVRRGGIRVLLAPLNFQQGEIESAIDALFAKPVSSGERLRGTVASISARCTRVDVRTAEDCHRIAELRAQLAAAAERNRRDSRIAELRRQARDLRERGAAESTDPVAELFSWMSRGLLSVRDVGFGFPVAFALLIELVSAFGPVGVATYAAVTRPRGDIVASPASPAPLTVALSRITERSLGSVVDFVAEGSSPASETTAISSEELHRAYLQWCRERGARPLAEDAFTLEFDRLRSLPALRGKIRKFGNRYFGIAVASATQKSLKHETS